MPTFHFANYELGTPCNLTLALESYGFTRHFYRNQADFTDNNLQLNETALLHLEQKNCLYRLVEKDNFPWLPKAIIVEPDKKEQGLQALQRWKAADPNIVWIIKPALLNNGIGIFVTDSVEALQSFFYGPDYLRGPYVVQQYIANPNLLQGCKYAFRLLVILTHKGDVYYYPQGYANISQVPYEMGQWQHRKMHVTNFFLDGQFANISQKTTNEIPHFSTQWPMIQQCLTDIFSIFITRYPDALLGRAEQAFDLLGFDFLIDNTHRLWLLEINHGPDSPRPQDNHPLYPTFWAPFWMSMVQEFIIPIVNQTDFMTEKWQKLAI